MARPRSLDRTLILDITEAIILESGGQGVTLDAVVARSGVSKGGLVGAYGSKEGLLLAVLEREFQRFSQLAQARTDSDEPASILRAYAQESAEETDASLRKMSFLLTAVVSSPNLMAPLRGFYQKHFGPLRGDDPHSLAMQRLFLGIEGASLMRGLGLIELQEAEWTRLFASFLSEADQAIR